MITKWDIGRRGLTSWHWHISNDTGANMCVFHFFIFHFFFVCMRACAMLVEMESTFPTMLHALVKLEQYYMILEYACQLN